MTNESNSCECGKSKKRKSRTSYAVLISCCLCLAVACFSLLAALVLIGHHLIYKGPGEIAASPEPPEPVLRRLPRDVKPISYDLVLRPDLESGAFRGTVTVTVNVTRVRRDLILNINNLTIDTVELRRTNESKVEIENVEVKGDTEVVVFTAKNEIGPGLYDLKVDYRGSMINKLSGLYRSRRKGENGTERYMATSKFEPTYARQAYPCFDEPNLKATYKVHLLRPDKPGYIALSNYPQIRETAETGGIMVEFAETVAMSTYLSCFIVSDFEATSTSFDNAGEQIPFKVYATPAQLGKTTYAGEVGKKVIEFYVKYFNIPYPLPKLDMVAIPDFVSGAMEHWGLVTYRETALLYSPDTHSASNKQRVATVVAHELAHSWFGNLVTMDWWNNLWLNEGFASYIEYKGVTAAEPDWQMMEQFIVSDLHSVLSLDATQGSHPIIQTVTTPDQITEVFDTISYSKGASVLRMLEYVVGETNFQNGVTNYLKQHEYGSAVSQDLWDQLQTVVGDSLNVTQFMNTFTLQMGYPILQVTENGDEFTFTQKRFLIDYETGADQKPSPYNYKWDIPVSYVTDQAESPITWFYHSEAQLTLTIPQSSTFKYIKFNPGQVGYYRVNYDETRWQNLIDNIGELSSADKAHLLEESFSIAESGELSFKIPLDLTKYLVKETDYYIPWSVASSKLQEVSKYLQNSQYDSDFKTYVVGLLTPAYTDLTWTEGGEAESHVRKLSRVLILSLACAVDHPDALTQAKSLFDNWIADQSTPISPDLRSIVYKYGMVSADEKTWQQLYQLFLDEQDANEKLKLMNGLCNVRNPSLLTKLIELAKDEQVVRGQDYFTLLQYIAANPVGQPIVWDYVRENWEYLVNRFGLNERYLGRMIPSITSRFTTNLKLQEMKRFFSDYPEAGAGAAAREQALETVSNNIKWLSNHKEEVEQWISANK